MDEKFNKYSNKELDGKLINEKNIFEKVNMVSPKVGTAQLSQQMGQVYDRVGASTDEKERWRNMIDHYCKTFIEDVYVQGIGVDTALKRLEDGANSVPSEFQKEFFPAVWKHSEEKLLQWLQSNFSAAQDEYIRANRAILERIFS